MQEIIFKKHDKLNFKANEAFKTLRTNILFCGSDIKIITLTSSTPNEGKTSVSLQLAKSFAEAGKKVLILDADIRKSVILGRYKVSGEIKGLSHYLTGQSSLDEIICKTDIENFNIIFAGPVAPNPSEILGSVQFEKLLMSQKENYDYIIIDAPPLGSVIDAALIAKHSDGAIMVVESGMISYKLAQRVKEQLEKSECRLLGVVLNKINMESNSYYGNYYGRYYGKYYGNYGE